MAKAKETRQKKKKGRSTQELIGIKTFTKYGLETAKGELLCYCDPPYFTSEYVYECGFTWEDHLRLHRALAEAKGKWLVSYNDCPEIRELYRDYNQFGFKRIHSMVQKYEAGKEFPELLIGNYDLYERERAKPRQLTLLDMQCEPSPEEIEKILKECVISCKIKK